MGALHWVVDLSIGMLVADQSSSNMVAFTSSNESECISSLMDVTSCQSYFEVVEWWRGTHEGFTPNFANDLPLQPLQWFRQRFGQNGNFWEADSFSTPPPTTTTNRTLWKYLLMRSAVIISWSTRLCVAYIRCRVGNKNAGWETKMQSGKQKCPRNSVPTMHVIMKWPT